MPKMMVVVFGRTAKVLVNFVDRKDRFGGILLIGLG